MGGSDPVFNLGLSSSENGGIQKRWLLFVRENPIEMDDNWGYLYFRKPSFLGEWLNYQKVRNTEGEVFWKHACVSPVFPDIVWANHKDTPPTADSHLLLNPPPTTTAGPWLLRHFLPRQPTKREKSLHLPRSDGFPPWMLGNTVGKPPRANWRCQARGKRNSKKIAFPPKNASRR